MKLKSPFSTVVENLWGEAVGHTQPNSLQLSEKKEWEKRKTFPYLGSIGK